MRIPPLRHLALAAALAATIAGVTPSLADDGTLGSGKFRLVGASFDIDPVSQTVPVGVAAVVKTVFNGPVDNLSQNGARVQAELTGPSVPGVVTLSTAPGSSFVLPALSIQGDYHLSNIRLTDGSGSSFPALHPSAVITVTDLLVSSITSRALTSSELAARGIVVNDSDFKAYSFSLGLAIQGKTIVVDIPTIVKSKDTYVPIGPPTVKIDNPDERFVPPTVMVVPMTSGNPPNPDVQDPIIEDTGASTPVFGILVFPGNIRFLNQFFSVMLMVQNGSAPGSGLSLRDVTTTVSVPASELLIKQTTPSVPDGQPIPVRNAGPDGVLGTGDDIAVLAAQVVGQAEFVTEGLKVGTHEVVCQIDATVDGIAGQPGLQLHGQARGSVLVRDPSFGLTFNHPDVVRAGEAYDLDVTVVNTSTVNANAVSITVDASSITGAQSTDVAPGLDPVVQLGDLAPGGSALAVFHFTALKTGRVVASSFTSDGDVTGVLRLRTGVAQDGTPLSPDSFVFPSFIRELGAEVVDPAEALIGIAHAFATVDPSAPGNEMLPPFADGVVQDRVEDLVEAARRAHLGQPLPSAIAELALGWQGAAANVPAFDAVRRSNNHGADFETGIGSVFATTYQTSGSDALLQNLVDAAVAVAPPFDPTQPLAGPVFVLLDEGSAPVTRLELIDPATGEGTSLAPAETGFQRGVPFGALYQLGSAELGVLGRQGTQGLDIVLHGQEAGTASLTIVYPDGAGGYRSAKLDGIPTAAGKDRRTHFDPSLTSQSNVGAVNDPVVTAAAGPIPASPFTAIAAVQDVDANPVGKAVTILFNRRVADAAGDMRLYALPAPGPDGVVRERAINSAQVLPGSRRVAVVAESVLCPWRVGSVTAEDVPAVDGSTWSGTLSIVAKLQVPGGSVEGRVIGPDGTPVANTQVQLTERSVDDISGEVFEGATSVVKTDALGAFFFDFVRQQAGYPFRLDSYDPVTGSKGYAAGTIHANGEVLHLDVALQGRGTVRGTVVSSAGAAMPGVIVRCAATTDPGFRTAQYSQADGSFAFTSVPIGPVQLQAEDPSTNRIAFASAMLGAPGATTTAQIVLTDVPHTSLSVKVLHANGTDPYPDLYVAGYSVVTGQQDLYFGVRKTDATGSVGFASVPAGAVRLEIFDGVSANPILVQPLTLVADQPGSFTLVIPDAVPHYGSVAGTVRQVVAGNQVPVAGAIVYESSSGVRTTTAGDGTYRLDNVPVGNASMVALLPATGRTARQPATVQDGAVSPLDFLFTDATLGTITGVVVDEAGAPRANASVELWNWGPPPAPVTSTTTAADGSFVLENVPVATVTLQAISQETRGGKTFRNAGLATATIPGPGGRATTTIALRGWVTVTGRVIARVRDRNGILHDNPVYAPVTVSAPHFVGAVPGDPTPDSGNPEYGAIFADNPGDGLPAAKGTSDPTTGAFSFPNLHGGHVVVSVTNPFYGTQSHDFGYVLGDATVGPVDLVFDQNIGAIDGTLYDVDGTPIPNAPLTLELSSPGWGAPAFDPLTATTHADGTFVFPLVPYGYGGHVVFQGTVNGIVRYADAYASVQSNAPLAHVTLRTLPVGTVDVAVVQPSGTGVVPVDSPAVRVDELTGPRRTFTATAGSDGRVTFPGVTGGPISVQARSGQLSGRTPVVGVGEGFHVSATVALTGTGAVSGVVRNPVDSTGIGGVNVTLLQSPGTNWEVAVQAATTDPSGAFSLQDVPTPPGVVYGIVAEDPRTLRRGYSGSFGLVTGASDTHDVTLRAVGSVAGRMTTFDGTAIPGADVAVSPELDFGSSTGHSVIVSTGPDGSYRADGVLAGSVSVDGSDPINHLTAHGTGRIDQEGQVVEVDLQATPTGTITGSVLLTDGTPLPSGAVPPMDRLSAPNGAQVTTGATYTFANVAATGPFVLHADEQVTPFHAAETHDQAVAGTTKVVDLKYGPFGSVTVHGLKPDPNNPGQFLSVVGTATVYSGGPYAARFPSGSPLNLDGTGSATFLNVGGGFGVSAKVVDAVTGLWATAVVPDFAENQPVDVTIVLRPLGVVRGRFLQPVPLQTTPASLVQVTLTGAGPQPLTAITGTDGSFEIDNVPLTGAFTVHGVATDGSVGSAVASGAVTETNLSVDLGDIVLDGVRPTVVSASPGDGTTGLGLTPTFQFTFSEPVLAGWSQVSVSGPYGPVGASVSLDASGTVLTVTTAVLAGATPYQVRLSGSITARSLLPMAVDYVVRFTTADLTAPTVLSSQPVPEQIQVPLNMNPVVVMTKAIDPATLAGGVHLNRLDDPAGPVAISPALQPDGRTISLNPAADLAAQGEYEIVLDAVRDTAGNALPSAARIHFFTVDTVAPTVTLDPPDTAQPIEGTQHTYTVHWADDDVKTVTVFIEAPSGYLRFDGDTTSPARTDRSRSVSLRLPTIVAAGGASIWVHASATDFSGNASMPLDVPLTLTPDAKPVVASAAVQGSSSVGAGTTFVVRIEATDDVGVARIDQLLPAGVSFVSSSTDPASTATDRVELRTYRVAVGTPSGSATLSFTATDTAGQQSAPVTASVTLVADAPPQIVSAAVLNSSSVRIGSNFTVRIEATDDVGVAQISEALPAGINAVSTQVVSATATDRIEQRTYFASTSVPLGTATIAYTATDTVGQLSSPATPVAVTITADAPPSVTISAPASGAKFFAGTPIPVTFTATDDLGLSKVVLTLGATTVTVPSPANGSPVTASITAPASGSFNLTAVATDTTGHDSTPASIPVTISTNQPPTLSILAPLAGATLLSGSKVSVVLSSSDDVAVTSIDASFPGQTPVTLPNPPATATLSLPVPVVTSSQAVTLTAHASDGVNPPVVQTVSVNVVPDAPPVLTVSAPADGVHVTAGAPVVVTGTLTDDNNDATATITFGSFAPRTARVGSFSVTYTAPNVPSSIGVPLSVTAVDGSGHQATPVQLTVNVDPDLVPPVLTIGSPAAGASVIAGLPVTLVASATDNVAVANVQYRVNGGPWQTVNASSVTASIPTSVGQTSLAIDVQASDGAGNTSPVATRTVTLLANQAPAVSVSFPTANLKLTSGVTVAITGSASDDSGTPSVSAAFNGTAVGGSVAANPSFSLAWKPLATSQPVSGTLTVTAVDPQGNATSVPIPVTVVPDLGGTPTVALSTPAAGVLVVGDTTSLSITYADNVGLATGEAEVTGGFTSSGHQTYALSGTSQPVAVPVASAEAAFGVPASITAKTTDLSARTANLVPSPTVLPVSYHRLTSALATSYPQGSLLSATFHISPTGMQRATMIRLEVGTVASNVFTAVTCVRKLAPLGSDETLSVPVPVGTATYYVRSVLVDGTGAVALAARADYSGVLQDALVTPAVTPSPAVAINPQASNPVAGSAFSITAVGTDAARITSVSVTYDGITKSCANATYDGSGWTSTCSVPFFAQATAGSYPVTATVTDAAGKTGTASGSITVAATASRPTDSARGDGHPPVVRFLTPYLSPEAVPENTEFVPTVAASDADRIARIEFFLDDSDSPCATQDTNADPAAPRSGCFVPRGGEGALHTLRVRVTDGAGETAEASAQLVVRDGVRITAPATIEAGDRVYEGQRIYVESDAVISGPLHVGELYLRHGARLLAPATGSTQGIIDVTASGDLVTDVGSRVVAAGAAPAGFAPDESAFAAAAGGPHGGDAGPDAARRAYDSFARPSLPGAAGTPAGTRGGGVIALRAARIVVGALVSADGESAAEGQVELGGIGAGGAVRLEADHGIYGLPDDTGAERFGHVSARGGSADADPRLDRALLGAGGRVALRAPEVVPPTVDVSGSTGADGAAGAPGTFYLRDAEHPRGALSVGGSPASEPTHLPAVGCGRFQPVASGEIAAPAGRSALSLVGLALEVSTSPHPLLFEITGWRAGALRLGPPPEAPRLGDLAGLRYCGALVLDELHVSGGARLVVGDRIEVPDGKTTVDTQSSLETP